MDELEGGRKVKTLQQQTREIISACFQFPRLSKEASEEAGARDREKTDSAY